LVQKSSTCISGDENIDDFIQNVQLEIKDHNDIVLEWIPYSQFNKIEVMGKYNSIKIYSAIWRDGPLYWNQLSKKYMRKREEKVAFSCLHRSQLLIVFLLIKV
jgi:hypothetical protein